MDTGGIGNMPSDSVLSPRLTTTGDQAPQGVGGFGVNTTGVEDNGGKVDAGLGAPPPPSGASIDTGEVGGYEDEGEGDEPGEDEEFEEEEDAGPDDQNAGAMDLSSGGTGGTVIVRRIIRRRRRVIRRVIVPASSTPVGDIGDRGDRGITEGGNEGAGASGGGSKWGPIGLERPSGSDFANIPTPDTSGFGSTTSMAGSDYGSVDTGFDSASTTPMAGTDFGSAIDPSGFGGIPTPAPTPTSGAQMEGMETEGGAPRGDMSFGIDTSFQNVPQQQQQPQQQQMGGFPVTTGTAQSMPQQATMGGVGGAGFAAGSLPTGGVGGAGLAPGTTPVTTIGVPLHSSVALPALQNLIDPVLNVLDNAHAKGTHIIHAEAVIYRVDDLPGSGPIEGRVERVTHVDQSNPDAEPMVTASYYTSPAVGNVNTGIGPGTEGVGSVGTAAPL